MNIKFKLSRKDNILSGGINISTPFIVALLADPATTFLLAAGILTTVALLAAVYRLSC